MAEFDLIARIRRRTGTRPDVAIGIGDDAAVMTMPPRFQLVVAMDTLNSGVHFPDGTTASAIGWKALAVNLSDLAAMGAIPAWCTLSLSLPDADAGWVDAFLDGFLGLATLHDVALVGGDTTRGPLSICVAAHGLVEPDRSLRRDRAQVGDDIWVSGTLGDAAAALRQWRAGATRDDTLLQRLERPTPRIALGRALAGLATACIDVSDGLLADLGHVCRASGVGARIEIDALPASTALSAAFDRDAARRLQAGGGDDYELCFAAPPGARERMADVIALTGVPCLRIGYIVAGKGVDAFDAAGDAWQPGQRGYDHFGDTAVW